MSGVLFGGGAVRAGGNNTVIWLLAFLMLLWGSNVVRTKTYEEDNRSFLVNHYIHRHQIWPGSVWFHP